MQRIIRTLSDVLALLFGFNPRQRALAILLAAAGLVTLNWFSSATLILFGGEANFKSFGFWLALLGLPVVFVIFLIATRNALKGPEAALAGAVTTPGPPAAARGLVLFLSTLNVFQNKLPPGRVCVIHTGSDIDSILQRESPDWRCILDHVQASNMQVALEAIQYHLNRETLQHVWVLSTSDMKDEHGQVSRAGSQHLTTAFKRIVHEGLQWKLDIHCYPDDEHLIVPPYDLQSVYELVDRVYREEAPRAGLHPRQVIADITGGTVTMTAGMILAGALFQRPLQFTAAQNDPLHGKPLEQPEPYAIEVDESLLRRLLFPQLMQEEESPVFS